MFWIHLRNWLQLRWYFFAGENVCCWSCHKNQHISSPAYKNVRIIEISSKSAPVVSIRSHFIWMTFFSEVPWNIWTFDVHRCISEGTIIDNGQLICLYLLVIEIVKLIRFFHHLFYTIQNIYICQARLLERELSKCFCLVSSLPMQDMDKHFGRNQLLQNIIPPSTL